MPTLVFLTHTQPFPASMVERYAQQGLIIHSSPCVASRLSLKKPPKNHFDTVIVSSFMSMEWLDWHHVTANHYYCIGPQSAQALLLRRPEANVVTLDEGPYTLKNLIEKYTADLISQECYWLGSHQGKRRYVDFFDKQSLPIKSHITHWNWPIFHENTRASFYYPEGSFVICSSISAAMALSQLTWDTSAKLLLSSSRLLKYFSAWPVPPLVSNEHWIKEISYN